MQRNEERPATRRAGEPAGRGDRAQEDGVPQRPHGMTGRATLSGQWLARAAMLVALGTLLAGFVRIPAGVATATPVQHAVNVLAAVQLGPGGAVAVALATSALRNALGLGTLLAFPGSLFGAALAGLAYRLVPRPVAAVVGEVVGTGVVGGLAAVPIARWALGHEGAAWFFYIIPFALSSLLGALLGWMLLHGWSAAARRR